MSGPRTQAVRIPVPREGVIVRDRDALRPAGPLRDRRALRSRPADDVLDLTGIPTNPTPVVGDPFRPASGPARPSGPRSGAFRHATTGTGRRARRGALLVLVALLVVAGAAGYRAYQVRSDLDAAGAAHSDVGTRLVRYEWPAAGAALDRFADAATRAAERTSGPDWALATRLPGLGDDAAAQRRLAADLSAVAAAARPVAAALPKLSVLGTKPDAAQSGTGSGRVDAAALKSLVATVPALTTALEEASGDLAGVPSSGLTAPVAADLAQARDSIEQARSGLRTATPLLNVLPGLFGADGPRTWVVLLEQPSGRVGAYAVARADRGTLQIRSVHRREAPWTAVHAAVPHPDFVLTLDPQAMTALSQATGATGAGPAQQLRTALTRVASGAVDWPELFRTLPGPVTAQQLRVHAADASEQARLVAAGVADTSGRSESARVAAYLTR